MYSSTIPSSFDTIFGWNAVRILVLFHIANNSTAVAFRPSAPQLVLFCLTVCNYKRTPGVSGLTLTGHLLEDCVSQMSVCCLVTGVCLAAIEWVQTNPVCCLVTGVCLAAIEWVQTNPVNVQHFTD